MLPRRALPAYALTRGRLRSGWQASPLPSSSMSVCFGLRTDGQLSVSSGTASPSRSGGGVETKLHVALVTGPTDTRQYQRLPAGYETCGVNVSSHEGTPAAHVIVLN